MKAIRLLWLTVVSVLVAGSSRAQEYPRPGPEHERLKALVGAWEGQVKAYFEPGKPAHETKGDYNVKLDVGGYFLVTEVKSQLLGMPFQGRGLTGYDPFKKKYVGVWVDSMGPTISTTEGTFDKTGKVLTEILDGPDPMGKPMKMRITITIKSADKMDVQMHSLDKDGKGTLVMDIAYTRKK